jgi:hypothetical protein
MIWEATKPLLLIPVVIGLVMLVRWFQGGQYSPTVTGVFYSVSHGRRSSHSRFVGLCCFREEFSVIVVNATKC